jgi:hypothetical protein
VCTQSLGLAPLDFGGGVTATLTPTVMNGLAVGPFLAGTALVTNVGPPLFTTSDDVGANTINGGPIGTCHSQGAGYLWHVNLQASQMPAGPNTILIGDADSAIQILDDPDNVYTPYWSLDPNNIFLPAQITFQLPINNSSPYFSHPYRPTLYIRTSSGSHAIRLPQLVPVSQPSLQQIIQQNAQNIANCEKVAAGWLGIAGQFDPNWLIDPGPEGYLNVVEFQVASAAVNEVIAAQAAGNTLATATGGGLAALSLAVAAAPDAHAGGATSIEMRRLTAPQTAGATARRLPVLQPRATSGPIARSTQRLLQPAAALRGYGGGPRRLSLARYRGQVCAIIASAGGVEVVSLRTPSDPRVIDLVIDADGALPSGMSVVSWGRHGLHVGTRRIDDAAITQLVAWGRYYYALGERGLTVYDQRWARIEDIVVEHAGLMAVAGAQLAIASPEGVSLFTLDDPTHPRPRTTYALTGVRALAAPPIANGSQLLLVERSDGPFLLLDVTGVAARVAAEYFTRPWFSSAVARDGVIARVANGAAQIFIERARRAQVF